MKANGTARRATINKEVADRLVDLRRKTFKTPADIARLAEKLTGKKTVSESYLRRLDSGKHSITIEKLDVILETMGSNLGLFFEYLIPASDSTDAKMRRYHSILQRGLDNPDLKERFEGTLELLEQAIKNAER